MRKTTIITSVVSMFLLAICAIGALPLSYCLLIGLVWAIVALTKMSSFGVGSAGMYGMYIIMVMSSPYMEDVERVTHSIELPILAELWSFSMVAVLSVVALALTCLVFFVAMVIVIAFSQVVNGLARQLKKRLA